MEPEGPNLSFAPGPLWCILKCQDLLREGFVHRERKYPKDCITEAICELTFAPTGELDSPTIQELEQRLQEFYPVSESLVFRTLRVEVSERRSGHEVRELGQGCQLKSSDGKNVVRIAPSTLSIHRLAPYDHWEAFGPRIFHVLDLLHEVRPNTRCHQLKVRYINVFHIQGVIAVENLFAGIPDSPYLDGEHLRRFSYITESFEPDSPGRLLLTTLGSAPGNTILLDLNRVYLQVADSPSEVQAQLLESHARIGRAFEALITDELRATFLGAKEEHASS